LLIVLASGIGSSKVGSPDQDCLVIATNSDYVLILSRENYLSNMSAVTSALFGCSLIDCARVTEKLDKSIFLSCGNDAA
jgi:hypothetical protein